MELTFRHAHIDDLSAIVTIYNSTIAGRIVTADLTPISITDKLDWFHQHNPNTRPLWMVEMEQKLVGWVSLTDFYGRPAYSGTAEISIYLDEHFRGNGIGKMILEYVMSQCPTLSIHTLLGFIFEQNTASLKLFTHAGFSEWGHLPDVALLDKNYCNLKILGKKIDS